MELCRACLTTENITVPLEEDFINDYNLLTKLNIKLCDGLPQYSCENCVQTVKYYINFREKCISSESVLQQMLEKVKAEGKNLQEAPMVTENLIKNIVDVKQEVKIEQLEDSSIFDNCIVDAFDFDADTGFFVKIEGVKPRKSKRTLKRSKKFLETLVDVGDLSYDTHANPKISKQKKNKDLKLSGDNANVNLSCGLCEKTLETRDTLTTHLESHKIDNRCEICSETFSNWPPMFGHRLSHLPEVERRCHLCLKRYRTPLYLEFHYINAHFEGDKPKLSCRQCSRTYDTARKLKNHYIIHSSRKFICDYCSKTCNTKQTLRSHMKSHSDSKEYVCDMCGFSCKQSSGLVDHKLRRHTPGKIYCKHCTRVFRTKEGYDKHTCLNISQLCPICGIQIVKPKRLSRHLETHVEVGKYKCNRCPAAYKSRSALATHTDKHDGVRKHQCEYCPLKFYSHSVLIKHRRIHTGEKPYVCKICQKAFTGNSNLKVHMKVHGEYLVVKKNKNPDEEVTTAFK